jgi:hypothetical protein
MLEAKVIPLLRCFGGTFEGRAGRTGRTNGRHRVPIMSVKAAVQRLGFLESTFSRLMLTFLQICIKRVAENTCENDHQVKLPNWELKPILGSGKRGGE